MPTILYNDRIEIGLDELTHIYLALLTTADRVWLNAGAAPTKSIGTPTQVIAHVEEALDCLQGRGLVRLWCFPGEEPSQHVSGLKVLDPTEYADLERVISDTFLKRKDLFDLISARRKPDGTIVPAPEESTSKIIAMRKEYWSMAVASILGADQVLNNYGGWHPPDASDEPVVFKEDYEPLVQELFRIMKIGEIGTLSVDDIASLQPRSSELRRLLEDTVKVPSLSGQKNVQDTMAAVEGRLLSDLADYFHESSRPPWLRMLGGAVCTAAAILIPPIHALPIANEFLDWLRAKRKYGYMYYLSSLRRRLEKRG
jgi:hypothetical protein